MQMSSLQCNTCSATHAMQSSARHNRMLAVYCISLKTKPDNLILFLENSSINCLEIGFGTGTVTLLLASQYPNSQFYSVDICKEMIDVASKRARDKSLSNVHFIASDTKNLPADWSSKFDYAISCNAMHDFARPDLCLKEIKRILKTRRSIVHGRC